jgi:hypothetical protein
MESFAKSIELPNNIVYILSVTSEDNGELSLLFLQVNEHSEETGDDVVFALSKHFHQILLFLGKLFFIFALIVFCLFIAIFFVLYDLFPKRNPI